MAMEVAAAGFVGIDVLTNALVANRDVRLASEPARDLFRTSILPQITLNQCPRLRLDEEAEMLELTLGGFLLRLLGTIATSATIAREFTRDGRRMPPISAAISSCDQSAFMQA